MDSFSRRAKPPQTGMFEEIWRKTVKNGDHYRAQIRLKMVTKLRNIDTVVGCDALSRVSDDRGHPSVDATYRFSLRSAQAQSRPDRTTDRFRQPWSKQSRVANVMNGWSWTTGGAAGRLEKAAEQTFYIDVIERRYSATSARERRSSSPALTFSL